MVTGVGTDSRRAGGIEVRGEGAGGGTDRQRDIFKKKSKIRTDIKILLYLTKIN